MEEITITQEQRDEWEADLRKGVKAILSNPDVDVFKNYTEGDPYLHAAVAQDVMSILVPVVRQLSELARKSLAEFAEDSDNYYLAGRVDALNELRITFEKLVLQLFSGQEEENE